MSAQLVRRDLTARPGRQAFILATVLIAVAFTTAGFAVSDSLGALLAPTDAANALSSAPLGTVTVSAESDSLTTQTAVNDSLVADISARPDVATANGGYDQPVSFRVRREDGLGRPPLFRGLLLSSTFDPEQWSLTEGRAPSGPNEVALDNGGLVVAATTLDSNALLELPTGLRRVRVVGRVQPTSPTTDGTGTGTDGTTTNGPAPPSPTPSPTSVALAAAHVVLDPTFAPALLDAVGRLDQIVVVPQPGLDPDTLAARLTADLPDTLRITAITSRAAAAQATVSSIDSGVRTATLIEAGLTSLVAALVVTNLLSVLVAHRTREMGLLRAVGASRTQLTRTVLGEAAIVGVIASVLGTLAGGLLGAAAVHYVQPRAAGPWFISTPNMWLAAAAVGIGVTMLGSVGPAIRAGRVAPLEALNQSGAGAARTPRLSRWVFGPIFGLLERRSTGRPITTRLAVGNLSRHPTRTAAAASTLMIGMALVGAVATVSATAHQSIETQLRTSGSTDLVVQRRGLVRVSTDVMVDAFDRYVRGIGSFAEIQTVDGTLRGPSGTHSQIVATGLARVADIVDLGVTDGNPATDQSKSEADTGDGSATGVMLSVATADELGATVGETISLTSTSGRTSQLQVVALYRNTAILGPAVVSREAARSIGADGSFELAAIRLADGAPAGRVQRRLDYLAGYFPKVQVNTPTELAQLDSTIADTAVRVASIMLFGAVGLGFLGLGGTLALSTLERRRELVMLRAIGSDVGQIHTTIAVESLLIAGIAAALGLALGVGATAVAARASPSALTDQLVIPWLDLLGLSLLAMALAWAVARVVSRRATRVAPAEVGRFD